jgi:hypothetical protein
MSVLRLERRDSWPRVPWPALVVVAAWLGLVVTFNTLNGITRSGATACALKTVTGVPCPTCGGTRAATHLAHGDVLAATAANPLVSLGLMAALVWVLLRVATGRSLVLAPSSPHQRRWLWAAGSAAFIANWAYVLATDGPWAA